MRLVLSLVAPAMLSACFAIGEEHLPSATRDQIEAAVAACGVADKARVEDGRSSGETPIVIHFDHDIDFQVSSRCVEGELRRQQVGPPTMTGMSLQDRARPSNVSSQPAGASNVQNQ